MLSLCRRFELLASGSAVVEMVRHFVAVLNFGLSFRFWGCVAQWLTALSFSCLVAGYTCRVCFKKGSDKFLSS